MSQGSDKLLKIRTIADEDLANLMRHNTYQDLYLPCEIGLLTASDWEIQETTSPHFMLEKLYRIEKQFSLNNQLIATYTLYYDLELDFLDEWLVSY